MFIHCVTSQWFGATISFKVLFQENELEFHQNKIEFQEKEIEFQEKYTMASRWEDLREIL